VDGLSALKPLGMGALGAQFYAPPHGTDLCITLNLEVNSDIGMVCASNVSQAHYLNYLLTTCLPLLHMNIEECLLSYWNNWIMQPILRCTKTNLMSSAVYLLYFLSIQIKLVLIRYLKSIFEFIFQKYIYTYWT